MKVSISWLKELIDLNISVTELVNLLPLRSVSIKEFNDDFFELDMKGYNRADLLSMRGVAREVAAITDSRINFSDAKIEFPELPEVEVAVEDNTLCPVYCVAEVQNLKVKQSNNTWVKKLSDCGLRSINNVADITNLVMLEYGQPMHAFDSQKVSGIVSVKVAKKGEKIITLDGKTRNLSEDLVIADEKGPIGIAGVLGGKDSEVSNATSSILLEAAIFDPVAIRKTAQRQYLPSEASKRFQHGLIKTNLLQALAAAIKMYEDIGGKLTAITLLGNLEDQPRRVELSQKKTNSLIGIEISPEQVKSSLKKLGFSLGGLSSPPPRWNAVVPFWRLDINIEEDIIEEVTRMYGYENIPAKELEGELPKKIDQSLPNMIYDLKKHLSDLGLTEVQTYSFYSSKTLVTCHLSLVTLVKIANPISSETEYMRDALWPNLVEAVTKNIKNGFKDVAIFEIGKVYLPPDKETYHLAIALMNGSDNPLQELYAIASQALGEDPQDSCLNLVPNDQNPEGRSHPKRNFLMDFKGKQIGMMAEIHPRVVNKFGIDQRVAVLEIELETIYP